VTMNWLVNVGVRSFYEMTSLSQSLREKLDEHFCMDYGVRKVNFHVIKIKIHHML